MRDFLRLSDFTPSDKVVNSMSAASGEFDGLMRHKNQNDDYEITLKKSPFERVPLLDPVPKCGV